MAKKVQAIKEATHEDAQELLSVAQNKPDIVMLRNKRIKVKWMHFAVGDWISSLIESAGNDHTILAKCAALIRLNGFWKCHLWYWFLWRWYYYIRQYTAQELLPLIQMAQKKTAQEAAVAYLNGMMLLTALSTTQKQMTKEEAERTLQELRSGNDGKSAKSTE